MRTSLQNDVGIERGKKYHVSKMKYLLLLLYLPLIGMSQEYYEECSYQLESYVELYDIEDIDFEILTSSEKVARGYLLLEEEIRGHFNIDGPICFNDNLIGDINGDQIDDFIVLYDELFLFSISNGEYFAIPIHQLPDNIDNDFEGINSLFFTHIEDGKLGAVQEDMYYKESFDEWRYPLWRTYFTLQQLQSLYRIY